MLWINNAIQILGASDSLGPSGRGGTQRVPSPFPRGPITIPASSPPLPPCQKPTAFLSSSLRTHITAFHSHAWSEFCGHSGPQGTRAAAVNFLPKELYLYFPPHALPETHSPELQATAGSQENSSLIRGLGNQRPPPSTGIRTRTGRNEHRRAWASGVFLTEHHSLGWIS